MIISLWVIIIIIIIFYFLFSTDFLLVHYFRLSVRKGNQYMHSVCINILMLNNTFHEHCLYFLTLIKVLSNHSRWRVLSNPIKKISCKQGIPRDCVNVPFLIIPWAPIIITGATFSPISISRYSYLLILFFILWLHYCGFFTPAVTGGFLLETEGQKKSS